MMSEKFKMQNVFSLEDGEVDMTPPARHSVEKRVRLRIFWSLCAAFLGLVYCIELLAKVQNTFGASDILGFAVRLLVSPS